MESLEQVLVRRAAEQPGREAFLFLRDGEGPAESLTYGELDRRARAVAVRLAETLGRGERALLLYPPGLDFAAAFFGCLYARLVAVPAPPPDPSRLARTLPRLESILADAKPAVVLTTAELAASHDAVAAATTHELPPWIATDEVDLGQASTWSSPGPLDDEALVYLQFTSGSTSAPKGVMGTQGNLLHNCRAMREAWGYTPRSVAVIWVPNFHDDGLVHGTVLPVFAGHRCVLMPPLAVVRQPERWLRAISRFRATHSGGPNFIYSLAARKVRPEACRDLDLASWRMAYNAAEPVRYETLAAFHRTFSRHGFRWDSFYPAYGLAETTLLLSTRARDAEPALLDVDRAALEQRRVVERSATEAAGQTLVSSGRPIAGTEVRIVDPETRRPCRDGEVSEIWVANPSVARGYWQREEATEETFGARPEGDPSTGPFLRTGDLGFLAGGEVFVTGRFKDLILVRGRNVYPQDVEATVEASHPLLRPGCSAAFSVEAEDEERLAVIAEIGRNEDGPEVASAGTALSFAQERIWFLDQLETRSALYNVAGALELRGGPSVEALRRTFEQILRRHEVLHTRFASDNGKPVPVIGPPTPPGLALIDLWRLPGAENVAENVAENAARRLARREAGRAFDLERGPLLRTTLFRLAERRYVLLLVLHHIVADEGSLGVLGREMEAFYAAFSDRARAEEIARLPALAVQYADFAAWQRRLLGGTVLDGQFDYWRAKLAGAPLLELATDRPRPSARRFRGQTRSFRLPARLAESVRGVGHEAGATLFMTLLAAFEVVLHRFSQQDDFTVGTPVANRHHPAVEDLVGFFVNTLVLRTAVTRELSFRDLLSRVREDALEAFAHQDLPFEHLVERLGVERDLSRTPLFQVMCTLQTTAAEFRLPGLEVTPLDIETGTSKFDLTLMVNGAAAGLAGRLEYSTELFDAATAGRLVSSFAQALRRAAEDPGRTVGELALPDAVERHQLLVEWNDTAAPEPRPALLHAGFERQALATPAATALVAGGERLTYAELGERSARLARHLRDLGVGPEVRVAICVPRSPALMVAILAVLEAGGAYVPLDPEHPAERLAFTLEDARARVLVTEQRFHALLPEHGAAVLELDRSEARSQNPPFLKGGAGGGFPRSHKLEPRLRHLHIRLHGPSQRRGRLPQKCRVPRRLGASSLCSGGARRHALFDLDLLRPVDLRALRHPGRRRHRGPRPFDLRRPPAALGGPGPRFAVAPPPPGAGL